jgi:hypothetical protein
MAIPITVNTTPRMVASPRNKPLPRDSSVLALGREERLRQSIDAPFRATSSNVKLTPPSQTDTLNLRVADSRRMNPSHQKGGTVAHFEQMLRRMDNPSRLGDQCR